MSVGSPPRRRTLLSIFYDEFIVYHARVLHLIRHCFPSLFPFTIHRSIDFILCNESHKNSTRKLPPVQSIYTQLDALLTTFQHPMSSREHRIDEKFNPLDFTLDSSINIDSTDYRQHEMLLHTSCDICETLEGGDISIVE